MKTRGKGRRAQAEVIGAIFFIVLAITIFGLFTTLTAAQYALARQASEAQLVVGYRAGESLTVRLSQGTVTVRNNGPTTAVMTHYIGVNGGGQQSIEILNQSVAVAPRGIATIVVSRSFQSVGVITSYGNTWWSS